MYKLFLLCIFVNLIAAADKKIDRTYDTKAKQADDKYEATKNASVDICNKVTMYVKQTVGIIAGLGGDLQFEDEDPIKIKAQVETVNENVCKLYKNFNIDFENTNTILASFEKFLNNAKYFHMVLIMDILQGLQNAGSSYGKACQFLDVNQIKETADGDVVKVADEQYRNAAVYLTVAINSLSKSCTSLRAIPCEILRFIIRDDEGPGKTDLVSSLLTALLGSDKLDLSKLLGTVLTKDGPLGKLLGKLGLGGLADSLKGTLAGLDLGGTLPSVLGVKN